MDIQTESLMFSVQPDEHLGSKIYTPRNPDTIVEMNRAASLFQEKIGPNTAKFVQLTIMEEAPNYPEKSQQEIDACMSAFAFAYQETADKDPFDIIGLMDMVADRITQKIRKEKEEGSAHGVSEVNNLKLHELGKAAVLVNEAMKEVVKKFPQEYLDLRAIQAKNKVKSL